MENREKEFDEQFGFILSYGLTDKTRYNALKDFYASHPEAFPEKLDSKEPNQEKFP